MKTEYLRSTIPKSHPTQYIHSIFIVNENLFRDCLCGRSYESRIISTNTKENNYEIEFGFSFTKKFHENEERILATHIKVITYSAQIPKIEKRSIDTLLEDIESNPQYYLQTQKSQRMINVLITEYNNHFQRLLLLKPTGAHGIMVLLTAGSRAIRVQFAVGPFNNIKK